MTPSLAEFIERLAKGETLRVRNESGLSHTLFRSHNGRLEYKGDNRYTTWKNASHWSIEALQRNAGLWYAESNKTEPEQPKRQVRSIDLSE